MENKKRLKVLHIISGYGGGISSHIRNLARVVDNRKVSFDVIGFTNYSEDFIEDIACTGGKTFTFLKPKKVGFLKFYTNALEIIRNNGPYDVIISHTSGHYTLIFKMLSIQSGTKRFVVHAHKTQYDKMDRMIDQLRVKADQYFSTITADQLTSCSTESSQFVFGKRTVEREKIIHVPNSIPLEKYILCLSEEQKKDLKICNNIPLNQLIIGNMGRFNHQKNHHFMIKIIEHMVNKGIHFTWLFIGAGELEGEIKSQVEKKELSNYVRFLGRREDANFLYQLMDVFVLPSFYEGLPTVIVEAQAAGIPSVISDTITKEVDLELNLVTYLSLDNNLDSWVEAILCASKDIIPNKNERIDALNRKGFNNSIAGKIYEDFLFGKLNSFTIGEDYQSYE